MPAESKTCRTKNVLDHFSSLSCPVEEFGFEACGKTELKNKSNRDAVKRYAAKKKESKAKQQSPKSVDIVPPEKKKKSNVEMLTIPVAKHLHGAVTFIASQSGDMIFKIVENLEDLGL